MQTAEPRPGDKLPGTGTILHVSHRKDWTRLEVMTPRGDITFDVPATLVMAVEPAPVETQARPRKVTSSKETPISSPVPATTPSATTPSASDASASASPTRSPSGDVPEAYLAISDRGQPDE